VRYIVCSDIHGRLASLNNVIRHSELGKNDQLIVAGDFCDIGKQSWGVYYRMKEVNAIVLLGNHETAHMTQLPIRPYDYVLDVNNFTQTIIQDYSQHLMDIAYAVDDILITHAGVAQGLFKEDTYDASELANYLNIVTRQNFSIGYDGYVDMEFKDANWIVNGVNGPLWWRPFSDADYPFPSPCIRQICGHTPASYMGDARNLVLTRDYGYYMIDPYREGFDDSYYRYAIIETQPDAPATIQIEDGTIDGLPRIRRPRP
jgi:hypothetical protein